MSRSGRRTADPSAQPRQPPSALDLLTVGLLVTATITYRYWRSRHEELPQVAAIGRTQGIPASRKASLIRPISFFRPLKRPLMRSEAPSRTPRRSAMRPTRRRSSST